MGIHKERDGSGIIIRDRDGATQTFPAGTTDAALLVQYDTFVGPNLTVPDQVPMDRVRMFLIQTNRKAQVEGILNSLPAPMNKLAMEEFQYAPNFVPKGPLGPLMQLALALNDADYAEAVRDMAAFAIEDYGSPKPSVLAAITKFFFGG